LYLHELLTTEDQEKILARGIALIHNTLNTTINKLLHVFTCDQTTANNLTPLTPLESILNAKRVKALINKALFSFHKWQRTTNVALSELAKLPALKEQKELWTAQVAVILNEVMNVKQSVEEELFSIFIEHVVRVWNSSKKPRGNSKNKECTHESPHHWPQHIKCKPNPKFTVGPPSTTTEGGNNP
jgi:hypothetical protein